MDKELFQITAEREVKDLVLTLINESLGTVEPEKWAYIWFDPAKDNKITFYTGSNAQWEVTECYGSFDVSK